MPGLAWMCLDCRTHEVVMLCVNWCLGGDRYAIVTVGLLSKAVHTTC